MTRQNNFDALRFWAAVAVLWSHAFPLGEAIQDPLTVLTHGQTSIGSMAVAVFFVISGYLITWSYKRTDAPRRFAASRLLRIMPGLLVMLLITVFIAGLALTDFNLKDYFENKLTYRYLYMNIPIFTAFGETLPGVFSTNPYTNHVNGSLWTLGYEVRCYGLVLILGLFGWLTERIALALYVPMIGLAVLVDKSHHLTWETGWLTALFLAGAILYLTKLHERTNWVLLSLIVMNGAVLFTNLIEIMMASAGAYLIIATGASKTLKIPYLSRFGDLSYGTYIYAFPVQQIIAQTLGTASTWFLNGLIATPIVLTMAALSWRFIEKPALALKERTTEFPSRSANYSE
jgi:peptidoglycan/LPS O-acetylase OafA/YrhL